ncbi:hypothetical protein L798_06057, partial [Zootermopsis nevadensis]
YETIILPVGLYGCETWSLTQREEHGLQVFENRVLRRIFGPRREDDGAWRKLHNDELKNLYSSLSMLITDVSAASKCCTDGRTGLLSRHVPRLGTDCQWRKPEGKRPLGRPRRRWEDNIRRYLWEIGVEGDWILFAQDRVRWRALVNSVMNLRVP